jgi:hypothetical protein
VFTLGGIWGVLIITPLFFLEGVIARMTEPFSHPDAYYGFAASTLALQFLYLLVGHDPARYRPLMLVGIAGKLLYVGACWGLFAAGRIALGVALVTLPDLLLATLFAVAWARTGRAEAMAYSP